MKSSRDYQLEDLLHETEKTLKELESFEDDHEEQDKIVDEQASEEVRRKFITAEGHSIDFQLGGYAEIKVSEDKMHAYADIYPPSGKMKPLSLEDFMILLENKKITEGIDWEAIKDALFKCSLDRRPVLNVCAARGRQPVDEVPAHFLVQQSLLNGKRTENDKEERIDFREVSPFVLVQKGEVLARRIEKQEGVFGSNVLGGRVPYRSTQTDSIKSGKNTKIEDATIIAMCDGIFEFNGESVNVNEVLQIEKNVDYSTGNIDFPGDVVLKGLVQDGFHIHAGGRILCNKTLDASTVEGEKDLIVKQGIIGRKKGSIKVNGTIKTKFIENCYVEAKKTVYAETGIMNSAVYTLDRVELGKKGVLVGGTIFAQNGLSAMQIGTATGPATEIYCGVDFQIYNKLEWIRDNNIKLATKLKQIELQVQKASGKKKEQLLELKKRIKEGIHSLNSNASSLIYKLDKNDNAEVSVKGKVYPGVYIDICHVSYVVGWEMSNVCFKLSKDKGRVITEDLP